ncbi:MAG: LysR family transcriptional regulator [Paracoccaceae bacterium]
MEATRGASHYHMLMATIERRYGGRAVEFHQIRYFIAASDKFNFTPAAEAAGVSQPAMTVAIRKLEDELGGPLFLRQTGGLVLTDLGREMRTHLARIDETRRAAREAARALLEDPGKEVALGVYSTIGPRSISGAIGTFETTEPEVRLVIHDVWGPKAYELLLSGAFEAAIVARHGPLPERIAARPLYREPMVLAIAADHPWAGRPVLAAELAGLTYLDRLRCEYRAEIQAELGRRQIPLRVSMRSEPEDWVLAAVAAGRGVTIIPRDQVVMPGVASCPLPDLVYDRVIEIATVAGRRLPPAAERLVRFLSEREWE